MIVETALMCLSLNIYHESRSEPLPGRYAVAQVTINRARSNSRPVCEEVFRHRQFSWTNAGVRRVRGGWYIPRHLRPRESAAWAQSRHIARAAMRGRLPDFSRNAHFYHHATQVRPTWASRMRVVARIGNHVFYVDKTRSVDDRHVF